jgi:hypothetical protein
MALTGFESCWLRTGEDVTEAVDICSREEVLIVESVRPRDFSVGSARLNPGLMQKSADTVGEIGCMTIVSRLLLEDSLLCGDLRSAHSMNQCQCFWGNLCCASSCGIHSRAVRGHG